MPAPYDTVISIGGQSLVDGVWRLLGPALEGLSNPLPLALPGFSNAAMRIKRIIPVFPGRLRPTGALDVEVAVELTAEALLNVNVSAGNFTISLGPQDLHLTNLTGTIDLPAQTGTLLNLLGTQTGTLNLPASTPTLTNGDFTSALSLNLPRIPLPAVVPIAINLTHPAPPVDAAGNLTPSAPLVVRAALRLTVTGIDATTRFGLLIDVSDVSVDPITLVPALAANLTTTLQTAVNQIVQQIGIPPAITQSPIAVATVSAMLMPLGDLVRSALADALTTLLGETGRLVYPPAATGASCDVRVLPTSADAQLTVNAADGTYVLQLGFGRPGSTDIAMFPTFMPTGIADTTVNVGNMFLLELLCCLVQRLPAFTLPVAAVPSTTDVRDENQDHDPVKDKDYFHTMCCNFTSATIDLGPIALNGGLSVCIDGAPGNPKTFTLVGHFAQTTSFPALADVTVDFTLPLTFDLDDLASLANLSVVGTPTVSVIVRPSVLLITALAIGGILLIGPAVGVVAIFLLVGTCAMVEVLLNNAVRTVLRAASLLRSPLSIPPGVFEAFGKLVPVTVSVDDLTAHSVLQTPTSPWALLPRIGLGRPRRPVRPTRQPVEDPSHRRANVTHD